MSSSGCKKSSCACNTPASDVGDLAAAVKMGNDADKVIDSVKKYYGDVLTATEDLKTSACLTSSAPPPQIRSLLSKLPNEVVAKYYGCGTPIPLGIEGMRVLDLGSGSGRDCYVCAAMVGPKGFVTGLDMTPSQLEVARRHAESYCTQTLGFPTSNMSFVEGKIEDLAAAGIQDESVDVIISNCVVNLSPDKSAVLREAYRVLAPGGEMYFSDVYCDRRLPIAVRTHPVLLGECLGGALYEEDFLRLARGAGFEDPRRLATSQAIEIGNFELHGTLRELQRMLGEAKFYSITYRLFKLPGKLESACEDYGQAIKYKGTIPGSEHSFILDENNAFQTGKWYQACGNTAAMVGESWLGKHFEVIGDRNIHFGKFFDVVSRLSVSVAGMEVGAASKKKKTGEPAAMGACCG